MKTNPLLMALVAAGLALPALAADKAPFTVQDLVKLNKLHSAAVSNDGTKLIYGLKKVTDDGSSSDLYLLDLSDKNAAPKQLTSAPVQSTMWPSAATTSKSILLPPVMAAANCIACRWMVAKPRRI